MTEREARAPQLAEENSNRPTPLVEIEEMSKYFNSSTGFLSRLFGSEEVKAVDDVSLDIRKGETLGLVGESGCGKSTLARAVLQLDRPTSGSVKFDGRELTDLPDRKLRSIRKDMQMMFQDPQSSLDPRQKIGAIIEEPMRAHGLPESDPDVSIEADIRTSGGVEDRIDVQFADDVDIAVDATGGTASVPVSVQKTESGEIEVDVPERLAASVSETATGELELTVSVSASKKALRRARARELLEMVGLEAAHYNRHPHELSGGQRQRVNLARALSTDPELIICDEPVSALDVTIQAQVLNTMRRLQEELGITYLFISHDLSVVRYLADRVAVMYLGQIVELAEKEELFENPQHPYTQALLEAVATPDPRDRGNRGRLEGDVPSPIDPPSGCRFRTRCPRLIQPGTFAEQLDGLSEEAANHRLDTYDMDEETWRSVVGFSRAVQRRNFAVERTESVRDEFFPNGLPAGDARPVVEEAISLVEDDEWEEAERLLRQTFEENSICAVMQEEYSVPSVHGDGDHMAMCHLHRD